ncbi:UPF3 domain,RNA recognition motif domain [Cinara cedri]|uniref:UPF3 domain,RNA recognition motif domain n=1 Tax=Cinara cedri TaxID=506608 RepID=A0A5E4M062_9HEMI|nr:UPF3 domain,RNA recognition motif domain [Cinara cedri]
MIKENAQTLKAPEKVDDFLSSLFKSLDRQKSKDDRKSIEKKVVVRRLPPTMTEERFLNEVSPLPENNYMYFIPGDPQAAPFHHSRVYISFLNEEDMYMFTDKFDGYVFVDDSGDEFPAIVELAPYQRIPKKKLDKDPNWGKIHENLAFLEFKRNFEQKTIDTTLKTTQHFFESVEDKNQERDLSTPLLEYLAKQNDKQRTRVNQRDERRKKVFIRKQEKEEVRRNNRKTDKEIFIKPKPISKKIIEEKPIKDTIQKKILKNHREDSEFVDEKKTNIDETNKTKNEDPPKENEFKKIEFKLKTNKLNNTNKCFNSDLKDEIPPKVDKMCIDESKEVVEIKKKFEKLKLEQLEKKATEALKNMKLYEDKESVDTSENDNYKKHRSDTDKKCSYHKKIENRHQESKTDRRIRNKDRPAIEIYRPGMGRLSKLKSDNDCVDSELKK